MGSSPALGVRAYTGVPHGVQTPHRLLHAARRGRFSPQSRKSCRPHPQASLPPCRPALTLDGAEAPALVLAVVLGGGTPQVPVLAACAGAAVEPLVVILEGDGAGFPVGVALDGVDLCKEGSRALASGPLRLPPPITQGARSGQGAAEPGRAVTSDNGFKAPSSTRWSQEPGRGPAAHPTGLGRGPPMSLIGLSTLELAEGVCKSPTEV